MKNIYISIFEGIYISFMFNYFKTKYSFNHPLESIITQNYNFIKHPINSGNYESKICPLGNLAGYLLLIWFILRNFIKYESSKIRKFNNLIVT